MTLPKRIGLLAAIAAVAAALLVAAWFIGVGKARSEIHAAGERQLQIIALDLEAVLDRFETLPFTLAFQPEALQVLEHPEDAEAIARLDAILKTIQQQAKVAAIYMMDRDGKTLASSNSGTPQSYVGQNFSFRPYHRNAMRGEAGRFYAIGSTTGEPGYFIAQPVYAGGHRREGATPIGVIAVKIGLAEFERTWTTSEDPIALADHNGVIFLSNRAAWRYHSLEPLGAKARQGIANSLQYAGQSISPLASLPRRPRADGDEAVARPVGRLGWHLMLFPSHARILRAGWLAVLAAAMALGLAGISLWAAYQRRRRLEERIVSRHALQQAAEELDRRISQRTTELLSANRDLEAKYAELQETERLLRSTQNELVQAGKLTMLGQMAAGVTHELNQPLAAIRAFADNAVTFLERGRGDRAAENLGHISAASARMGAIIAQLKGFARRSHGAVAPVDLAQSIRASALLLQNDFDRRGARLEIDIRDSVQVVGDTVRTEQVLINLMRNALDAVEAAPARVVTITLERDGADAVIRIADTGHGIPEQIVQHLFEPFFTTKPSEKGLGLGLAISSSIVQAMNGQIEARNRSAGGAEFVLRLPASDAAANEGASLIHA
ncbi:MAG: sensor histidine kinase [Burkholderiaceae bacterium]